METADTTTRDTHPSGHHHGHNHNHEAPKSLRALIVVLTMTATFFNAEVIGGYVSGSLALIADAMHMFSDAAGLVMAAIAILIGNRPPDYTATYGYRRIEIVSAFINAITVTLVSLWIVWEAIERLNSDVQIDTGIMLWVAVVGLIANIISAIILNRHQSRSLNMRGAFLHVLSDMLGSIAVIIAGVIIRYTGWVLADTISSLVIAAIIVPRSIALIRSTLGILLERVPSDISFSEVKNALSSIDDVEAVHDLHIWTIEGNKVMATCHLVLKNGLKNRDDCSILDRAQTVMAEKGIEHATIQIEDNHHKSHEQVC